MEKLDQILMIALKCLGYIITITGFLIPLVKNVKAKNKLIAINKLATVIQGFIVEAEEHSNYTGAEKKEYVMTKTNRYAIENKIPYDEQAVSDKVEEMVALSKEVNVREHNTQVEETNGVSSIRI